MSLLDDRTRIGDQLHSEASRLAEWVLRQTGVPYEVVMAAAAVERAVQDWTQLRCSDAKAKTANDQRAWNLVNK